MRSSLSFVLSILCAGDDGLPGGTEPPAHPGR